jgi:hypothetical protein
VADATRAFSGRTELAAHGLPLWPTGAGLSSRSIWAVEIADGFSDGKVRSARGGGASLSMANCEICPDPLS